MALGWVLYRPDENHNGTVDLSLLLARRQRHRQQLNQLQAKSTKASSPLPNRKGYATRRT